MKKYLAILIIIYITLMSNCFAASNITITINGDKIPYDNNYGYPYIDENNRTMVPLRISLESAGTQVGYDNNKSTAIIMTDHTRIEVPIGTDYIWCNNKKIQNDTFSVINNNRTYLPIRIIFESLGYTVDWIASSRTIDIYNYDYRNQNLEPIGFDIGSIDGVVNLLEEIEAGLIVYKDGQYYSTPKWRKMQASVTYHVYDISRDVNEAIYPEIDYRSSDYMENVIDAYKNREWIEANDLLLDGAELRTEPRVDQYKGFYSVRDYSGGLLYAMSSIPFNFEKNPCSGTFDGIEVKVEDGKIYYKRLDLVEHHIIDENENVCSAYGYEPSFSAPNVQSFIDVKIDKISYDIQSGSSLKYGTAELKIKVTNKLNIAYSTDLYVTPRSELYLPHFEYSISLEPNETKTFKAKVTLYENQFDEVENCSDFRISDYPDYD